MENVPVVELVMETGVVLVIEDSIEPMPLDFEDHVVPNLTFICVYSAGGHQVWVRRSAVLALIGWNQPE